jgi:hypothetical protein
MVPPGATQVMSREWEHRNAPLTFSHCDGGFLLLCWRDVSCVLYSIRGTHEGAAKGARCLPVAAAVTTAAAWGAMVLNRKKEEIKRGRRTGDTYTSELRENTGARTITTTTNNNITPHNGIALRRRKHNAETVMRHVLHA